MGSSFKGVSVDKKPVKVIKNNNIENKKTISKKMLILK
jgi:hypothetical protein